MVSTVSCHQVILLKSAGTLEEAHGDPASSSTDPITGSEGSFAQATSKKA